MWMFWSRCMQENLYSYWGKALRTLQDPSDIIPNSYHLAIYHNLDVAACAKTLLTQDSHLLKTFSNLLEMPEQDVLRLITYFIATHDIGKFSKAFQSKSRLLFQSLFPNLPTKMEKIHHGNLGWYSWTLEGMGLDTLFEHLGSKLEDDEDANDSWKEFFRPWIAAVAGHHGTPPDTSRHLDAEVQIDLEDRKIQQYIFVVLWEMFCGDMNFKWDDSLLENSKKASHLLNGLAIFSDWLGSDEKYFRFISEPMPLSEYWEKHSIPQARLSIKDKRALPPKSSKPKSFSELFPKIKEPTPLQDWSSKVDLGNGPNLFILEDTTGSGKTEAALMLAHRLISSGQSKGMYVALPTMATSNAMFSRVNAIYREFFEEDSFPSLVLAHSANRHSKLFRNSVYKNWKSVQSSYSKNNEDSTASFDAFSWITDTRKLALLSDVGIGTIDQALVGAITVKHQALRLLGLCGKVLIVDEVHAYDPYMLELLQVVLSFQAMHGSSVILLSATLPVSVKDSLRSAFLRGISEQTPPYSFPDSFPQASITTRTDTISTGLDSTSRSFKEFKVNFVQNEIEALETVLDAAKAGGCACWVRNSVSCASSIYDLLESYPDIEPILFHSAYALSDRQKIEQKVLKLFGPDSKPEDRAGKILIATQVVEQSLDIDFDVMVTDLAPIDLVIQRAGRLHRHDRVRSINSEGSLTVLAPQWEDNPDENWLTKSMLMTSFIYQNTLGLWLTQKVMREEGIVSIPEKARHIIEYVYGYKGEIPDGFLNNADMWEAEVIADKIVGKQSTVERMKGFGDENNVWTSDTRASTRLIEPTNTVRLALIKEDGTWSPWDDETGDWTKSEINVRVKKLTYEYEEDILCKEIKNSMFDKGKWSVLMTLRQVPEKEGLYEGTAFRGDKLTSYHYCSKKGFRLAE